MPMVTRINLFVLVFTSFFYEQTTVGIQWTVQWSILMVAKDRSQNSLFGKMKNKSLVVTLISK